MDQTTQPRVIAATVAELPHSAAERFANNLAARYKRGDEWHELSYAEIGEMIDDVALGLIDLPKIEQIGNEFSGLEHLITIDTEGSEGVSLTGVRERGRGGRPRRARRPPGDDWA